MADGHLMRSVIPKKRRLGNSETACNASPVSKRVMYSSCIGTVDWDILWSTSVDLVVRISITWIEQIGRWRVSNGIKVVGTFMCFKFGNAVPKKSTGGVGAYNTIHLSDVIDGWEITNAFDTDNDGPKKDKVVRRNG